MTGAVYKRTENLGLGLLRFNFPNWADDANNNMSIIDAGFSLLGPTISGSWKNATTYIVGTLVADEADGTVWRCMVEHTSATTGTFAQERAANPTYWTIATVPISSRGVWTPDTQYFPNDIVSYYNGTVWAIAARKYVSSATFDQDVADGNLIVVSASSVTAIVSDTPPVGVVKSGQLWWESDSGNTFVWYQDPDGGQWVQAADSGSSVDFMSKGGGTFTGVVHFDNGTNPIIPTVPVEGMWNVFGDQLRCWCDLDGDGDYDADFAFKSNGYLVYGARAHFILGKQFDPLGIPAKGRIIFTSSDIANYIQSGYDYGATTFRDLLISRYLNGSPWMVFDESGSGNCGVGYLFPLNGDGTYQIGARLHVIDNGSQVGIIESTTSTSNLAFKDATTVVKPQVGSSGNQLALRTNNLSRVQLDDTSVYPVTTNAISLGKSGSVYTAVWATNGTIQTSDERIKNVEGPINYADALALVDSIAPKFFKYKIGGNETVAVEDGFEEVVNEEKGFRPINKENEPEVLEEYIVRTVAQVPKYKEVTTTREGVRLHAGFIAQEVKLGMDQLGKDFGMWGLDDKDNPKSMQHINTEEMVAVLWAAVRALSAEVKSLKEGQANV